ncbi:integrase [uncultured Mediterranean phage uvDeep-CGR0-KM22-C158]|nr:integrase [uncultured Mediterranean phage uvDeep-CGR0-KM22-C158]
MEISSFIACKNHLHRVWKTDLHEIPLAALLPEHIQEVMNHMEKVEKVSYGTIKNFRDNLRNALNRAIELKRITVNPILVCKLPKERRRKKVIWTRPQLDGFLEYIRDDGYHYSDAFELILFTGLRRAEICGLHWSMVNFEEHYLDMNRTRHSMPKLGPDRPGGGWYEKAPKSEMGLRYLEISPRCVALLRRVQAKQAHFQLRAPGIWPADPFVICRPDGTVTRPDKMGRYFRKLLDRYNAGVDEKDQLPMVTPHDLRRHHASYLAELGYTTSAIAARLGHASTTITDRVYIRNRPGAFSDYVEKLDEFLDGPVDDR